MNIFIMHMFIKGRHFLIEKYKSHFIQALTLEYLIIRMTLGYGRWSNGKCQENSCKWCLYFCLILLKFAEYNENKTWCTSTCMSITHTTKILNHSGIVHRINSSLKKIGYPHRSAKYWIMRMRQDTILSESGKKLPTETIQIINVAGYVFN